MIRDAARKRMREVTATVEQVDADAIETDTLDDWLVIDVREADEYAGGHLPGALPLPRSRLEMLATQTDALDAAADKPALVYCASGKRSLFAAQTLAELGVQRPVSMAGGFNAWRAAGKPESRR